MTIYAILNPVNNHVKLGYTADVNAEARVAALQTASAERLALLGTIPGASMQDELRLHRYCEPWRKNGEWFEFVPEVVEQFDRVEKEVAESFEEKGRNSVDFTVPAGFVGRIVTHHTFSVCGRCACQYPVAFRMTADGKLRDQPRCGPCRNLP